MSELHVASTICFTKLCAKNTASGTDDIAQNSSVWSQQFDAFDVQKKVTLFLPESL